MYYTESSFKEESILLRPCQLLDILRYFTFACIWRISGSLATTIAISQPSYEVNKSSGHQELSVDTLTITLGLVIHVCSLANFGRK